MKKFIRWDIVDKHTIRAIYSDGSSYDYYDKHANYTK